MTIPALSRIIIHGTKKSLALSNGEVFTVTIKPGEYRKEIKSIEDLISHINDNAYRNGDWVSNIIVGGVDHVREILIEILRANFMNVDLALHDALELGFLMHADHLDVINLLKSTQRGLET